MSTRARVLGLGALIVIAPLAAPLATTAQPSEKVWRIGVLYRVTDARVLTLGGVDGRTLRHLNLDTADDQMISVTFGQCADQDFVLHREPPSRRRSRPCICI